MADTLRHFEITFIGMRERERDRDTLHEFNGICYEPLLRLLLVILVPRVLRGVRRRRGDVQEHGRGGIIVDVLVDILIATTNRGNIELHWCEPLRSSIRIELTKLRHCAQWLLCHRRVRITNKVAVIAAIVVSTVILK